MRTPVARHKLEEQVDNTYPRVHCLCKNGSTCTDRKEAGKRLATRGLVFPAVASIRDLGCVRLLSFWNVRLQFAFHSGRSEESAISKRVRKFYGSVNAVVSRLGGLCLIQCG